MWKELTFYMWFIGIVKKYLTLLSSYTKKAMNTILRVFFDTSKYMKNYISVIFYQSKIIIIISSSSFKEEGKQGRRGGEEAAGGGEGGGGEQEEETRTIKIIKSPLCAQYQSRHFHTFPSPLFLFCLLQQCYGPVLLSSFYR